MSRPALVVLLIAAAAGGWYFFNHYQVLGLQDLSVGPRTGQHGGTPWPARTKPDQPPVQTERDSIRIATFNLGGLDRKKLSKRHVAGHLVNLIRDFDIVAVQDIHARNQGLLVELIDQINSQGRHYDFATCPTVSYSPVQQYSALLFDRTSVGIDRSTIYSVHDPADRFHRKPLVASFRARGPDPAEAFTFTLINVHTDPDQAATELDLLDDVLRAVRDDGRDEDDVILLGDLGTDHRRLEQLAETLDISWAVPGIPGLRGTQFSDNVLFDCRATSEFTGRSGVVDLMREFDLTMQQALEVSDHLPVWAEFSVYEGGYGGHVAAGLPRTPR